MNTEDFIKSRNEAITKAFNESIETNLRFRFASHERLYKLIFSASTLSLTGWVVLIGWKFEPFSELKSLVYWSFGLFVGSLFLIALSDLSVIIQSALNEYVLSNYKKEWLRSETKIESQLIGHNSFDPIQSEQILKAHSAEVSDFFNKSSLKTGFFYSQSHRALLMSWVTGILGIVIFFVAICFSLYNLTVYLEHARS